MRPKNRRQSALLFFLAALILLLGCFPLFAQGVRREFHVGGVIADDDPNSWEFLCAILHPDYLTDMGVDPDNCSSVAIQASPMFGELRGYFAYLRNNQGFAGVPPGSYYGETVPDPSPFYDGGMTATGKYQANFTATDGAERGGYCVTTAMHWLHELIRDISYGCCYDGYANCDQSACDDCVGVTPTPDVPPPGAGGFTGWPVGGYVTAEYGCYNINNGWYHPGCPASTPFWHNGIDIAGPFGTPILMVNNVQSSLYVGDAGGCNQGGYGQHVVATAADGSVQSLYAHLDHYYVVHGQTVNPGDGLGGRGSSGCSTGPHLHFVTRTRNQQGAMEDQNPRSVIPGNPP